MNIPEEIESRVIRAQIDMMRLEASVHKRVMSLLKELEKVATDKLLTINPAEPVRAAYKQSRIETLVTELNNILKTSYGSLNKELTKGLRDAAQLATEQAASVINLSVGVELAYAIADTAVLAEAASTTLIDGAPSSEWWKKQSKYTLDAFVREVRKGIALNESIEEIVTRVRGVGPKAGEPARSGVFGMARHQAEALVRTSVLTVSNQVRLDTWQRNSDIVRGIQWVATLDTRTTLICQSLDGKTWDNDKKPMGHDKPFPGPTAHWGCRSSQMPLLVSWNQLINDPALAKKLDALETDEGTRASMGGQVPASLTYEKWLEKQNDSVQLEVLGRGRQALWKAKKITFNELVDQRGNPRTLSQLQGN